MANNLVCVFTEVKMVIKVFISTQSGNSRIKKSQEKVLDVLSGKKIEFEEIDISDANRKEEKEWMWEHGKAKDGQPGKPLPPQVFNGDVYCGDYDAFLEAVEAEDLNTFLQISENGDSQVASSNGEEKKDDDEDN